MKLPSGEKSNMSVRHLSVVRTSGERLATSPPQVFLDLLTDPEQIARVHAAITDVIPSYHPKPLPPRVHERQPTEKGIVKAFARGKKVSDLVVATSVRFPEWLAAQTELSQTDAYQVAAATVNSFAIIEGAIAAHRGYGGNRLTAGMSPIDQDLWADCRADSPPMVAPYRAAAFVALKVCRQEPLQGIEKPQPAHIASLAQPLSQIEFRNLHAILG